MMRRIRKFESLLQLACVISLHVIEIWYLTLNQIFEIFNGRRDLSFERILRGLNFLYWGIPVVCSYLFNILTQVAQYRI